MSPFYLFIISNTHTSLLKRPNFGDRRHSNPCAASATVSGAKCPGCSSVRRHDFVTENAAESSMPSRLFTLSIEQRTIFHVSSLPLTTPSKGISLLLLTRFCVSQWPLHKPNGMENVCNKDKSHPQKLCGKCQQLGYACIKSSLA